jgi:hypothetical protein
MKMQIVTRWALPGAIVMASAFALVAFEGGPHHKPAIANHYQDTIPSEKRNKTTRDEQFNRDFDKQLKQLDEAQDQIERLKQKDWDKMQRDIEESVRNIDIQKIQQQAIDAVQKIDFEKINSQIQASLQKIDFEKIKLQLDKSLESISKIDREAINKQLDEAQRQVKGALEKEEWTSELKKAQIIKKEELDKQMANVKKEMEKVREELKQQKFDMKKELEKARADIDKAKDEVKGYQQMIYDMEKDGLLNSKEDYSIDYKSGDLYINDKKQPADVTDKYKKYFKKNKIAIKKQNGDIQIRHHDNSDSD